MTAAWAVDMPAGEKLVLLALADCANDEGRCWPGIASLSRKTGKSERSLQGAIKALCAAGHLTRVEVPGKGCNYTVHPRNNCAPAEAAPPQKTAQTPAKSAGKPSVTITSKVMGERERAILNSPQWKAFKAMRRDIRKPINPTSETRLLAKLLALDDDGHPPGAVLDQSTENCWRGVFPIKDEDNDKQANRTGIGGGHGRMGGPRPDPTLALVRSAIHAQR